MKNLWDLWPSSNLPQSSSLPHWLYFLFPGLGKCFPGSSCYLLWVFAQLSSPVIVFLITLFKIFLSIPTLQPQHPHPCYLLYFLSVLFVFDLFFGCVGLHCYVGSFSSCGRPGPLSSRGTRASRCRGFSYCGPQARGHTGCASCSPSQPSYVCGAGGLGISPGFQSWTPSAWPWQVLSSLPASFHFA